MKNRTYLYLSILFLIVGILIGFSLSQFLPSLTGHSITQIPQEQISQSNYTYTTAICNYETKECIDIKVVCESEIPISISPISTLVKFNNNWEDFRESAKKLCEN